jgi:hypothetical protein
MSNELKPCPFCGGKVELLHEKYEPFYVFCRECDALVSYAEGAHPFSRYKTIEAYNRRTEK